MGKLLVLVLALLAPSLAQAAPFQDQHGDWWDVPLPPDRYLLEESRRVPFEVFKLPTKEIARICSAAAGKSESDGCAFVYSRPCKVYISEDLPQPYREAVQMHEVAHCFGWPADHPTR